MADQPVKKAAVKKAAAAPPRVTVTRPSFETKVVVASDVTSLAALGSDGWEVKAAVASGIEPKLVLQRIV